MREKTALMLISNKIEFIKGKRSKTLIVNLLGGPCAGKSTMALLLVGKLKEMGIKAEYVPEVAKEYMYFKNKAILDGSMRNQTKILMEQQKRLNGPYFSNMVDIIVTDSPLILNYTYNLEASDNYLRELNKLIKKYNNLYFFVDRGPHFNNIGRTQKNIEECIKIDDKIKQTCKKAKIKYTNVPYDDLEKVLNLIIQYGYNKNNKKNNKRNNKRKTPIKK